MSASKFGLVDPKGAGATFGGTAPPSSTRGPINSSSLGQLPTTITEVSDEKEAAIVHSYHLKTTTDGSYKDITDEEILLIGKVKSRSNPSPMETEQAVAGASLAQANNMFKLAHGKNKALMMSRRINTPAGVNYDDLKRLRSMREDNWFANDENKELVESLVKSTGSQTLLLASAEGILRTFGIAGFVRNMMGGNFDSALQVRVLNAVVGGAGYIKNYWGAGITKGTSLFLVLKRRYNPETATFEEFQLFPVACMMHDLPTVCDTQYLDHTGTVQKGPVFYVGEVLDNEKPLNDSMLSQQAAGIKGDPMSVKRAIASVPKLKILYTHMPNMGSKWLM